MEKFIRDFASLGRHPETTHFSFRWTAKPGGAGFARARPRPRHQSTGYAHSLKTSPNAPCIAAGHTSPASTGFAGPTDGPKYPRHRLGTGPSTPLLDVVAISRSRRRDGRACWAQKSRYRRARLQEWPSPRTNLALSRPDNDERLHHHCRSSLERAPSYKAAAAEVNLHANSSNTTA